MINLKHIKHWEHEETLKKRKKLQLWIHRNENKLCGSKSKTGVNFVQKSGTKREVVHFEKTKGRNGRKISAKQNTEMVVLIIVILMMVIVIFMIILASKMIKIVFI